MGKIHPRTPGIFALLAFGGFVYVLACLAPRTTEKPLETFSGPIKWVCYCGDFDQTLFTMWLSEGYSVSYPLEGDRRSEIELGCVYRAEIYREAPKVRLVLLGDYSADAPRLIAD